MRIKKIAFPRLVVLGLTGLAAAACSQETGRFADPFANPFQSRPGQVSTATDTAPTGTVTSQPLAPAQVATVPAAPAPVAVQPTYIPPTTGTTPAKTSWDKTGWDRNGGTFVTIQPGDTIDSLSRRFGVPPPALLAANNLPVGTRLQPGQSIVIPVYHQGTQPTGTIAAKPVPNKPAPVSASKPSFTHTINRGDTIYSIARRYKKSPVEIARANRIELNTKLRVGQKLSIPGAVAAAVAPKPAPRAAVPQPKRAEAPVLQKPAQETVANVNPVAPEPTPALVGPPQFRWPVQGRIISAFGPKPNGQHNDGFNIAVPENTPIKAAEDGIVAYAGNELKGYGNLVLIRHADGWVTAYAHASAIVVRRGEQVKRGQVIARAGQTGGVVTPQVHFEIRKGSQPVDPAAHLKTAG